MKILIVDKIHNYLTEKLSEVDFIVNEKINIKREELLAIIPVYDVLVIRSTKIDDEIIAKAERLKIIARLGAGTENINKISARKHNIKIINSPEGNCDSVAEQTLGLILSLLHNINKSSLEVENFIWDRKSNWGTELNTKTVGILGYGHQGKATAKKLQNLVRETIAFDKYKTNFSDEFVEEVSLLDFLRRTDILSIHIDYRKTNHQIINHRYINNFTKRIFLINTARGDVLNTKDLIKNLKTGKIKASALDVLEYENNNFENFKHKANDDLSYLLNAENVIITPHIAGWSDESFYKMSKILTDKIIDERQL